MLSPIKNLIVFDLETSGLSKDKNAIVEIAACAFNNELVDLKEYESGVMRVYDNREITQGALDANGITREQIANGRDPKEVAEEFCKYLSSFKVGSNLPVLVGQNSDSFDIPFLDNYLAYFKKDLQKYVNFNFTIDTMWWSRLKFTELTNFKLGTLCEANGIELINAHRAITDTRATRDLCKKYIANLRSESTGESSQKKYRVNFEF
jgi:DNA polymerase III epsilon subunit-like protein